MGGRRKRSDDNEDEINIAMQFLSDGGLDALKEGLPEIILNLVVS